MITVQGRGVVGEDRECWNEENDDRLIINAEQMRNVGWGRKMEEEG